MDIIFCFGASITFGRGEQPSKGWCGRLKQEFESRARYNVVYNLGIPGDTSQGLRQRMRNEMEARRGPGKNDSYKVVIAIGTNDLATRDGAQKVSLEAYEQNIKECIGVAKEWTSDIFVIEIPALDEAHTLNWESYTYSNDNRQRYNTVLKNLCSDLDVSFIEIDWGRGWHTKLMDGVHPNSEGYELMYEHIKSHLL